MRDFTGTVAVVTGGGTGVGRAVSLALGAVGAATVVVSYSRSDAAAEAVADEVRALGAAAVAIKADVRDEDSVVALMDRVVDEFGTIDILVNCAGATKLVPFDDLDGLTDDVWDLVMDVNVRGAFRCIRAAAPALRKAGGAVVNVASTAAHRAGGSSIAYGVSKAALLHLTRGLARSLAPEVTVNSVSPGAIESEWLVDLVGADRARASWDADSLVTPLGRVSTPDDVAEAVLAMLSARFVTGEDIIVDGGKHLLY